MKIRALIHQAQTRLGRAVNRREERRAAARYFATTGHDIPLAERSEWLRRASYGAPQLKHRIS